MAEDLRDRNDPELKYLSVERNSFNDPTTQAEWTQKRLVWIPHETQVNNASGNGLGVKHDEFTWSVDGWWFLVRSLSCRLNWCSNGAMKLFQPVSTIVPLTHPIDLELEWKLWNKMGNGDMTRTMSCICTQKFQFFSFSISSFFKFKLFFSFIRFHIHFSFTFCCCLSQLQRTSESQVVVLDFWS